MKQAPRCRYCCSMCHGHFATLRAFDLHKVDGRCDYLDERIEELPGSGVCKISDRIGITVYTHHVPSAA